MARGDHMPIWFNIQGKLELKQRDLVDPELGVFTREVVMGMQQLRDSRGPAAVKAQLETDLFISTRLISYLNAVFINVYELSLAEPNAGPYVSKRLPKRCSVIPP